MGTVQKLLKKPLLDSPVVLEPFARTALEEVARNGQTVISSMDQTDLGDRFAVLLQQYSGYVIFLHSLRRGVRVA